MDVIFFSPCDIDILGKYGKVYGKDSLLTHLC